MSLKLKYIVGNIFYTKQNQEEEAEKKSADLQQKINNTYGTIDNTKTTTPNPFLKANGELVNPHLNYQQLLDSPHISQAARKYISQATGLTPTVTEQSVTTPNSSKTYTASQNNVQTVKPSATGNTIADAAQKYIGTPYVWGGESMDEGGMDCSGFVYNALKDSGYNIGRTTAQGYRNYGTTVSKSDMQPGDLIFYGKNGEASHIGIYIGNGQMIHSSGGSSNTKANPGKGVSIVNVDHRSDFLEARRY